MPSKLNFCNLHLLFFNNLCQFLKSILPRFRSNQMRESISCTNEVSSFPGKSKKEMLIKQSATTCSRISSVVILSIIPNENSSVVVKWVKRWRRTTRIFTSFVSLFEIRSCFSIHCSSHCEKQDKFIYSCPETSVDFSKWLNENHTKNLHHSCEGSLFFSNNHLVQQSRRKD